MGEPEKNMSDLGVLLVYLCIKHTRQGTENILQEDYFRSRILIGEMYRKGRGQRFRRRESGAHSTNTT